MGISVKVRRIIWALLIGLSASLIAIFVSQFHLFETWELKTYDLRMVLTRTEHKVPKNVVLFYVDEDSLRYMENQGINWPWPRELYASVLDFCKRGGARAVIFDLFYSEDSVYGVEDDAAFAAGVERGPASYFVLFLSGGDAPKDARLKTIIAKSKIPFSGSLPAWVPIEKSIISLPIEPLVDIATGFGNAQIPPDTDGVYRRVDLIENYDGIATPSIPLKVASDILKVSSITWPEKNRLVLGDTEIPLDGDGRMMANYYGGTDTFPVYPLAKVLMSDAELASGQKPSINPDLVKDKIVVIGVAAPGLYDTKASPFSRVYPGPEVHATILENLLERDFINPLDQSSMIIISVLLGLVTAIGLLLITSSWGMALWLSILSVGTVGVGFYLFSRGVWMPVVLPFGSFALSAFAMIGFNFLTEGRKKREIRHAFKQYLSPDVVSQIADDPSKLKLGGIEREITIFFSDIANFTSISEKMSPAELVEELNRYFSMATKIIQESGGTLDKYIGDAIMAFWGAPLEVPDHSIRAVRAALGIQVALGKDSKFMTRVGIHTNPAIVGNIGSNIRFNYTVIGDAVNLASRLEGLNKKFGTRIIVSETSYSEARGLIEARRIGRVRVKGREEPIGIYEPLGLKGDFGYLGAGAAAKFEEGVRLFEEARFGEAAAIFDKLIVELTDPASKSYKQLCDDHIASPPENFDGVITFTTK